MPNRLVIFNAPPRAGKDTFAQTLTELLGIQKGPLKFAKPLKNAAHALLGLTCSFDAFEATKDTPHPAFDGKTPREFYIWLSEVAIKPNHPLGKQFFGVAALNTIRQNPNRLGVHVFSDGGFAGEFEVLKREYDPKNILIVQLERESCNFNIDSRSYVEVEGATTMRIQNNGSLDDIPKLIIEKIYPWLTPNVTNFAAIKSL
jgi:hypothetical protein